jgi:hypothetical protein
MTFHSHRIFRHLIRLLHASGENELAKRTFKLYVQLVTKSRQASMGEVESTIRRRRTLDQMDRLVDDDPPIMGDIEPASESESADNDRQFVECLIFGARMLCRLPGDVEDVKWAADCIMNAKNVMVQTSYLERDNTLKARLCVADGVVDSILAQRGEFFLDNTLRLLDSSTSRSGPDDPTSTSEAGVEPPCIGCQLQLGIRRCVLPPSGGVITSRIYKRSRRLHTSRSTCCRARIQRDSLLASVRTGFIRRWSAHTSA